MASFRILLLAAAALVPFQHAHAQDNLAPADPQPRARADDDFHGEIVVTAGSTRVDFLAGTSVVEGEDLQRDMAGQIGEVLAKLPGVSATSFAPGASRPVLRGFSGDRVRVLSDGIGSIDASNTSADHAVAIDPLTTQRIDVLRGPAVLLYGSQAIGGAVNVIGKRIPPAVPDEAVHVDALAGLDTASDRREAGASLDAPLGEAVAIHVDGSWSRSGDVSIPGYVASDGLRAALIAEAAGLAQSDPARAAELSAAADLRDVLPNSATETKSFGTGLAVFSGASNLGASFGYYDTAYGVPPRPGGEEGPLTIRLEQYRADLRGVLDLGDGWLDEVRTRWGYSDYTHTEFDGPDPGTSFFVNGVEGRVEFVQAKRGGWGGTFGAQFYHRDLEAVGEEAFVPKNATDQFGLFALEEFAAGPLGIQLAGRYERTDISSAEAGFERGFDSFSGALGVSHETGGLRFGVNLSRAERAPAAEELLADGPHAATQQFEIGDPGLATEKAVGLEGYVRGRLGGVRLDLAVYHSWFSDYIHLAATGAVEDGLPVYRQLQADARYFGIEGELGIPLLDGDPFKLTAEIGGDYTSATLGDGSPVERIPPLSLKGALEAESGPWTLRGEVHWYDAQARIAAFETTTAGFTLVDLSLAWRPLSGSDNFTLMLQANNLLDAEGRRHASFTKDFVPLPGRNIRLTARMSL